MNVQLPAEQHLEFLSLKGGCTYLPESTLVKMPHCWKSHVTAQMGVRRIAFVLCEGCFIARWFQNCIILKELNAAQIRK